VDVTGYGYAKVSKTEREKWGGMMEEYFQSRDTLKAVVVITDIRHEPTKDDVQMYEFLKYLYLTVVIIATKINKIQKGKTIKKTKIDKIQKVKKVKHLKQTNQTLQVDSSDIVIPFSAETGEGKDEAWGALRKYL